MPWFKIDDGFYDHPKVLELDMSAIGLWAVAGSYCARHLTDGVISERQIRAIGGTRKQAEKLVEAGLWRRDDAPVSAPRASGGASASVRRYVFNDWLEFQPSRDETTARRREDAERKRDARAAKRAQQQKRGNVQPDVHKDIPPESGDAEAEASERSPLYPTRPDPTRPSTPNGVLPDARADGGRPGGTTAFGDGTPIPPEPDDDRAELVLVTDDAPVVEIGSRAPKVHIGSSVQTLVRQHVPAGIPKDVQRKVAEQAQRLANDPNVDRRDLEAALTEWARRSDAGPGLLPHLVADAARARQGGKAGAARPEHKTRTLARLIAEEESNDQKGIS